MTFTEVVKVGKRDIVLANEHRFNVTRPRKRNGSWEPDTELLHADDPRVGLARQAARRARAKSAVRTAYEAWLKEQTLVAGTALAAAVFDWQAEQSDDSGTP